MEILLNEMSVWFENVLIVLLGVIENKGSFDLFYQVRDNRKITTRNTTYEFSIINESGV